MAIVYLITNKKNGKRYVGKTVRTLGERWHGHVGGARREDNDMYLCRAIRLYGPGAFEQSVIEECDKAVVCEREVHWIAELKTHMKHGHGYNMTDGGEGLHGYKFSEASKEKMRQKALGRKHTPEAIAKMSAAKVGKEQKPEIVARRAAANTGKKRTTETKQKISVARKGKPHASYVEKLSLTGRVLTVYPSIAEAARQANVGYMMMRNAMQRGNELQKHLWRYAVRKGQ